MAASAKMSFNYYQNGKYGTLPQNPTKDMEITQDMHLKMSKKIAQLTKVIYALNTKNDEHDAIIQSLKEQHEDEMQQLLGETKQKITTYKDKLDAESLQQKKIDSLEATIAAHERHRTTAVRQFENFKKEVDERETKMKTEHSQKMLQLSSEVLHAKKDFEDKLSDFETWKAGVNEEKEKALSELQAEHEKELEHLRRFQSSQNNEWLNNVSEVEEKYKSQLESFQVMVDELKAEKTKLGEDYEAKLAKAQLFYEKELEAVKSLNNVSESEAQRLLQEERLKMQKDYGALEVELRKQIQSLVDHLSDRESEVEKYLQQIQSLEASLANKDSNSSELSKQLQVAKQESITALTQLKEAESELYGMKERCSRQEEDMLHKSKQLGQLEATKLQNESTISDLQSELNKLRDRLAWLEKERNTLEKQKSSLSAEQSSQLKSLEAALEDLSIEKQTMKEKYERELETLRNRSSQSATEMQQQQQAEMERIKREAEEETARNRLVHAETLANMKQELMTKHAEEINKLKAEYESLQAEYDKAKADLSSRLKTSEEELARLEKVVRDSEQGLGSATGTINNLKEAANRLRTELDKVRAEHKEEKMRSASLQAELSKLQLLHQSKVKEADLELKTKLEQLSKDLENKWSETLRIECKKLGEEISRQKDSEMKAALEQLAGMKDKEIAATRNGWEEKVADLMRQIATLRLSLENSTSKTQEEMDALRQQAEEERKRLEQELLSAANEYLAKIQSLESCHEEKIKKMRETSDHEREELESRLKSKHVEDMQIQLSAHKASMDGIKEQAEQQRKTELQTQKDKHDKVIGELQTNLSERHAAELEKRQREHETHLQTARMELDRAVEISRQKERDHSLRVEELQGEIIQRERHITNLKEDSAKLQTTINHLNKEIDYKRQEIGKIKADSQNQLRLKEEQMLKKMESALDNLQADHLRESQELVNQFNEAQEILKDKISELQIMLEEAEERYHNRDSRPEDLEMIEQLRDQVLEREERMKALIEEKKYYQMELVNRETNFNKVFNSSPNVGVLNPLSVKKKKGDNKAPMKHSSAPSLSGRLEPLPNSPLHNSQLNPARPLPSFTKKFVK